MNHSFDVDIARKYGVIEAILINHLEYWIEKNKANNENYYEGYYWTYNSIRAFNELFPYVSQRQIQNALKHLKEAGIIQTGNFNKNPYDRTLWYSFTDQGKYVIKKCKIDDSARNNAIIQKCKMENKKKGNELRKNVEPIPNINTNNIKEKEIYKEKENEKNITEGKKAQKNNTVLKTSQSNPVKKQYGEYGWVKLSDKEYQDLLTLMGAEELKRCIEYIDSSAESTKNRNHWKGWKEVLRKCYKNGWGYYTPKQKSTSSKLQSFSINDLLSKIDNY